MVRVVSGWGVLVDGFPNLLMLMGPHAGIGNLPRAMEYSADWMTGVNRNVEGRGVRRVLRYNGGHPAFRARAEAVAAAGYPEVTFT